MNTSSPILPAASETEYMVLDRDAGESYLRFAYVTPAAETSAAPASYGVQYDNRDYQLKYYTTYALYYKRLQDDRQYAALHGDNRYASR